MRIMLIESLTCSTTCMHRRFCVRESSDTGRSNGANCRRADSLAMYGFGSSAHIVLQIVLARGCEVYVVTRGESHRELAREMGATWVGADAREMPEKRIVASCLLLPENSFRRRWPSWRRGERWRWPEFICSPIPDLDYQADLFFEKTLQSVTANTRDDGRELLAEAASISLATACFYLCTSRCQPGPAGCQK